MSIIRMTTQVNSISGGGPAINTWHFRSSSELASTQDIAAASNAVKAFFTAIAVRFLSGTTIQMQEQGLVIPSESEVVPVPTWTVSGTGNDYLLPPANALVVNWKTANVSRSGRGRTFLGPLCANAALDSNGSPTLAVLTSVQTAATNLIASTQGSGNGSFVVWSPTDGVGRDITSAYCRDRFAVLRSRRP